MMVFLFCLVLFSAAIYDWNYSKLPIEPLMLGAVFGLFWRAFEGQALLSLGGLVLGAGFLWLQYFVSRGKWIGMGDVYLMAMIGAVLGLRDTAVALYLTYVVGGVIALLLVASGVTKRKTRIPFAPFLALGAVGALVWGSAIAGWFADRI